MKLNSWHAKLLVFFVTSLPKCIASNENYDLKQYANTKCEYAREWCIVILVWVFIYAIFVFFHYYVFIGIADIAFDIKLPGHYLLERSGAWLLWGIITSVIIYLYIPWKKIKTYLKKKFCTPIIWE